MSTGKFIPIPGHEKFLAKKIIKQGKDGDENIPYPGCTLSVHYTGTLHKDDSKFDSSRDRNAQFQFKLGAGEVIKGWDVGMGTMKVGERAILRIHADYGYGERGSPPQIPGGATLLFDVEVFSFQPSLQNDFGKCKMVSSGELSQLEVAQALAAFSGCTSDLLKTFEDQAKTGKMMVQSMMGKGQPDSVTKLAEMRTKKLQESLVAQANRTALSEKDVSSGTIGHVTLVGLVFPEGRSDLELYNVYVSYNNGLVLRARSRIFPETKVPSDSQLRLPLEFTPVSADLRDGKYEEPLCAWASAAFNKNLLEENTFTDYWTKACGFPSRPDASDMAKLDIGNEGDVVTPTVITASSTISGDSVGRALYFARQAITENKLPKLY